MKLHLHDTPPCVTLQPCPPTRPCRKSWLKARLVGMALLCSLGLGTLGGCASGPKDSSHVTAMGSRATGYRIQGRFAPNGTLVPQGTATSTHYGYHITHVRGARTHDICQAQVGVRNTGSSSLTLQYRVFWYNAQGLSLSPSTHAWDTLTLEPQMEGTLSLVAPSPEATEFAVYLRTLPAPRRLHPVS
jgi:hypothetical protein